MSDLDIINSIASEPERPVEHVSLESIIKEVPCMDERCPAAYALYIFYNQKHLSTAEIKKVESVIEKLKTQRSIVNAKNIKYMERDDVAKVIEETE